MNKFFSMFIVVLTLIVSVSYCTDYNNAELKNISVVRDPAYEDKSYNMYLISYLVGTSQTQQWFADAGNNKSFLSFMLNAFNNGKRLTISFDVGASKAVIDGVQYQILRSVKFDAASHE